MTQKAEASEASNENARAVREVEHCAGRANDSEFEFFVILVTRLLNPAKGGIG